MRELLLVVTFPAVLTICTPASSDLVAHWPLDASGEDVVGGFEGLEIGGVTFGVEGANENTGTAADFLDGSIDVAFSPDLNPGSFTVTLWVRSTGGGGHRSPITSRYDGIVFGGGNLDGFILYSEPGNSWQFWTGDGESVLDIWDVLPGPPVTTGAWQHLAISFDEETSTKNLYVDGFLEATTVDQGYAPVINVDRALHIGAGGDMGDQYRWVGEIDDVGLWDEVLSEDDILAVMDDGVASLDGEGPPPCPAEGDADFADTHCTAVEVETTGSPFGASHRVTVTGEDESGDDVLFTVTVDSGDGDPQVYGPQTSGRFELTLSVDGSYRVTAEADDSRRCDDVAEDSVCRTVIVVGGGGFRRGDADDNGQVQLTDAVNILGFLFQGTAIPTCMEAADADNNDQVQLTDAVRILGFLFQGSAAPVDPGPVACGPDPDGDSDTLDCGEFLSCE